MKATRLLNLYRKSILPTVLAATVALGVVGITLAPTSSQANTHVASESNANASSHSLDSKVSAGEGKEMELKFPEPLPPMNRKAAPAGPEMRSNLIRGL